LLPLPLPPLPPLPPTAIECFDKAGAVVVPRTRFAPVKTTSDLFVLRSDVYTIGEDSTIKAVLPKVMTRHVMTNRVERKLANVAEP